MSLKMEQVVKMMKSLIEKFATLQEDQVEKGNHQDGNQNDSSRRCQSRSRDSESSSSPQNRPRRRDREDRSQSYDRALLRWSCNPRKHRSWTDKNEDEILNNEKEIDFEDLDDELQIDSILVENLEDLSGVEMQIESA